MEKPIFEQHRIKLYIISPVHIGCDDVYEPTNFVVDAQKKKLIHFDPLEFIKSLSGENRNKFLQLCMSDNILEIFKFIKDKYNPKVGGKEVEVVSGLIEHYNKVVNKQENINKFEIHKTSHNPNNGVSYIPGSSLKGTLRTAYLTKLALEKGIKGRRSDPKKGSQPLEQELLGGSFDTDPFRLVKISDFLPTSNVKTKIVYAINKKRKSQNMKQPEHIKFWKQSFTAQFLKEVLAYLNLKKKQALGNRLNLMIYYYPHIIFIILC